MQFPPPYLPFRSLCRIKKLTLFLSPLYLAFFFFGCIPYLLHVGSEQGKILLNRQKIDEIILEKKLDEASLRKLHLIQEAREFAITELGLNPKGGFLYFTQLDRDEIGWNVSASEPLSFTSYTWWFPIAGTVPYKGFFDERLAKELEAELKKDGLDTRIRTIGGYSTLGWFSDPVLSPQLKWKDYRLVGLVFHELAHATAYLPGDSDLNESYASFIEEKGMEKYFLLKEGTSSLSLAESKKDSNFRRQTIELLKRYAQSLDSIYLSEKSKEEKLKLKIATIAEFKEEVIRLKFVPSEKIEEFRKKEWNNEDFLGALRYHSGSKGFEKIFLRVNEDFSQFHQEIRKLFELSDEERKVFLEN